MDAHTRGLALRSAAKVAFGSLFLQCGGALTQGPADAAPPDDAVAADAATDAVAVDAQPDAALACTGPTDVDAGDVTEEVLQCCVADVASTVADASPWDPNGPDASLVASDPAADNCCRAIVARIDHEPDGGAPGADWTAASSVLTWCCDVAFEQGPACTPWGPPTPPAYFACAAEVA